MAWLLRCSRPLRLSLHPPALSSPLFIVSRGLHTPHASPVYEAPADCGTDGVCPTRHPRTQHPARAQPSFPSQAALPKLLLLPPPSSARRVHSSSFLTRNEKRCDRNARAVSNLFTEADSVPKVFGVRLLGRRAEAALVFGELNGTREGTGGGERKRRSCQSRTSAARPAVVM